MPRLAERLAPADDGPDGVLRPRIGDAQRPRLERLLARVWHADHSDVDVEHLGHGSCNGFQRRVQRQALRERPRDLVERTKLTRRRTLRLESALALVAEPCRLFVELRVLYRDRELRRERIQE